ncbi:MAG: RNA methyltransferase [Clostridia bacterium]|nr:RNA methyltransferase [Clostridia bacterium]
MAYIKDPSQIYEGMTSISALLESTESAVRILEVFIDRDKCAKKAPEIAFLEAKSKEFGFPIRLTDSNEIATLSSGKTHGGILARCLPKELPTLTQKDILPGGFYAYLDGMEDPYNFGYTVRSLYAAGADGVVLSERNWMSAAGAVARSSAGTSEKIPLFVSDFESAISLFKSAGYRVAAAGIRNAESVFCADCSYPLLLVLGGEKRGISGKLLDRCDLVLKIPYARPFRGSLPSASAASVLAFEIFRKNQKND